ncbi:MAG: hypothetical protein LBH01_04785 [Verrucomicrobiales bacterium]|jgi:hypothetical protein|nr:hypothetical protein [Verrucomicrobiales bacterium]
MKKLSVILLIVATLSGPVFAQDTMGIVTNPAMEGNLFKNGDMNNGTIGWQGDRRFVDDGDNRVMEVKAKKSGPRVFSQEISTEKATGLTVKFKYKTADYKGKGLRIEVKWTSGNTQYTRYGDVELKADGAWQEAGNKITDINASKVSVVFTLSEGEGTVYFDDIMALKQ